MLLLMHPQHLLNRLAGDPDLLPHNALAILQTTPDAEWWEPANAINPYPILSQR